MVVVDHGDQLDIFWEPLEKLIQGESALDAPQMAVQSQDDAKQFVLNYGYDLDIAQDAAELSQLQQEAVSFIERQFLSLDTDWVGLGELSASGGIPSVLKNNCTIQQLLIHASAGKPNEALWACAILKVMHILCHISNAVLFRHVQDAKTQIYARYQKAIWHDENSKLFLGERNGIRLELAGFEVKDDKSRDSMILKLLCKRENVAEEVFDLIGVRVITQTMPEALMALEILLRQKILIYPNIIPSRTRNSLIPFDAFKAQYHDIVQQYHQGLISVETMLNQIRGISTSEAETAGFNPNNPSSIETYRSIHITERQLIRVNRPELPQTSRFFFPYELQVVDEAHYLENMAGSSAHTRYKQKQLILARRRVLGPLLR